MDSELNTVDHMNFKPPKLPFGWLATTFIAPLLIAAMPNIFTSDDISFITRAVIGLAILSAMLFVSCIILMLQLYNNAYTLQVVQITVANLKEQAQSLKKENDRLHIEYQNQISEFNLKLEQLDNIHRDNDTKLAKLINIENELAKQRD